MDIVKFVNSKDIAEHLRNIKYEFSTIEAAWLIWQSIDTTLKERHEAWNTLIEEMPDCEMPERNWCKYQESIRAFLRQYMDIENRQYELFQKSESGAVYQYKFYCKNDIDWCEQFSDLFYTEQDVWKQIEEDMDLEIERIVIRKKYIGKEFAYIDVEYNVNREVVDIDSRVITDAEQVVICNSFDGLWFNFPVPFEKGDIVKPKRKVGPYNNTNEGMFVLDGVTTWEVLKQNHWDVEGCGDYTDMTAWGYFQEDDGRIYREVGHNYMDLEYYKGSFEGVTRIMKALSNYIKGKIDIELLLSAYRKVTIDKFSEDVMLTNWYIDEQLELAGLENVRKEKRKND